MSTGPQRSAPSAPSVDAIRGALRGLRDEASPDEREFAARLHRNLVAAGAPPSTTWLGRLVDSGRDLWRELGRDRPQKRTLLTGAVLGALVTATALSVLTGARPGHDTVRGPMRAGGEVWGADEAGPPVLRPGAAPEHKTPRTAGDHRPTRDRMGADIGAERPERPRVHDKPDARLWRY
jgi:hypothetical protein